MKKYSKIEETQQELQIKSLEDRIKKIMAEPTRGALFLSESAVHGANDPAADMLQLIHEQRADAKREILKQMQDAWRNRVDVSYFHELLKLHGV